MIKHIVAVGTLALALGAGCSAAQGDSEHQPASPNLLPAEGTLGTSSVSPGQSIYGPDWTAFDLCRLFSDSNGWFDAAPHFVVRLPDTDGARYGFTDGYSVPFPTPWVSYQAQGTPTWGGPGIGCDPAGGCLYEPDIYNFEHALLSNVAGIVSHQFLVYDLTKDTSQKDTNHYIVGNKQWFYNGTTQNNQVDERNQVVTSWSSDGHIEPQKLNCVYVLEQGTSGNLVTSGYHSQVAQTHDPINYPN